MDSRIHCAAARVSQNNYKIRPQMLYSIFDAAQLVVVDHIAGETDREQLADSRTENALRDHSRI